MKVTGNFFFFVTHTIALFFVVHSILAMAGEEITFYNGSCVLSGTLLTPRGGGPFAAAVFIHGSGAEDRSNSKELAKDFVSHGYAALIYDKRGVGKSGGDPKSVQYFSFEDLANDAVAATQFLSTRPEIDSKQIGLVASSQGGWVASLTVNKNQAIAFMVIISGSVTTVAEDNLFERSARLRKEGFDESSIAQANEMHLIDLEVSRNGSGFEKYQTLWEQNKTAHWFKRVYLSADPIPIDHPYRRWYRTVMDFDPVKNLEQRTTPILWIYGDSTLDQFCPVDESIKAIDVLRLAGKNYEVKTFPHANHSLVIGSKRAPIDETIFEWLKKKSY